MSDHIDAEYQEAGTAIAVQMERPAPPALFGTDDPVEVIAKATRVADALKAVIVARGLVSNIQGKEYPQVEAWQTLAVMLGIAAVCEWSRPIEGGWEARCIVQRNGVTIGAAEAQCTRSERTWKNRDDYAIRSMAQTRATSKSLRSVLGFVMVLAGYQATPSEEMPEYEPAKAPAPKPASKTAATTVQHPQAVAKDQETIPQMSPDEVRGKLEDLLRQIPEQRRIKVIGDATNGRAYALDQIKKLGDARAVLASLLGAAEEFDDERASARDGHLFGNTHDGTDIETEIPL